MSLLLLLGDQGAGTPSTTADLDIHYKPLRDDIARLLRARTVAGGGQTGEFNDRTDPTATEVNKLIDDAAALVAPKVGLNLPESTWPMARRVVALRTAMLIEIGSTDFDRDRYKGFKDDYKDQLAELVDAVQDVTVGSDPGEGDDRPAAIGSFPTSTTSWLTEDF